MSELNVDQLEPGSLAATRGAVVVTMLSLAVREIDMDIPFETFSPDQGTVSRIARAYSVNQAVRTADRVNDELVSVDISSLRRSALADCMETAIGDVLDEEINEREQGYTLGTGYEIVLPKTNRSLIKTGLQGEFETIPHAVSDIDILKNAAGRTTRVVALRRLITVGDFLVDCLHEIPELAGKDQGLHHRLAG